ncbi:MAG TPA: DUF6166 domain-containing protein [Actinomycetota bacterium]|nr:DUF6166 domain-containing protein [Actinomycetota bacterium]
MADRVYQGIRDRRGLAEVYVIENNRRRTLKEQILLFYEPFDLDWGFPGKESKNLALTLLADALEGGDDPLVDGLLARLHDEVVSTLPQEGWQINQWQLLDWIYGRSPKIPVHKLPLDALGGGVVPGLN